MSVKAVTTVLAVLVLILAPAGATKPNPCASRPNPDCVCPAVYRPVCACGHTFSNSCVVGCHGFVGPIEVTEGECKKPCVCTKIYDPVCGSDGETYANPCLADCAGVDYTEGPCPCVCTKELAPVCVSGEEFPNKCFARCAGFKRRDWTEGKCPEPCRCNKKRSPVCVGRETFSNKCFARCAGYKSRDWIKGKCRESRL